jgi:hypothetical protein
MAVLMVDLDEIQLAKLAREMVMNIRNYKDIFADYGIDEDDYYRIAKNKYYKKIKDHFALEWNSALSTEDRLRLGSLAYLEQLTPVLTRRAMREDTPLAASTDVGKFLQKAAGVGEGKIDKTMAERFVITINLGADVEGKPVVEKYNKSVAVDANDAVIDSNDTLLDSPLDNTLTGSGGLEGS